MKARIKATGEIVEAELKGFDNLNVEHYIINGNKNWILSEFDLEFLKSDPNPDYWTRLLHQYAGMAMQGLMTILPNIGGLEGRTPKDEIVDIATATAHALVEKMKEKEI